MLHVQNLYTYANSEKSGVSIKFGGEVKLAVFVLGQRKQFFAEEAKKDAKIFVEDDVFYKFVQMKMIAVCYGPIMRI